MCPYHPPCPPADRPDHDVARTIALHAKQGWSQLYNGIILIHDTGQLLPPSCYPDHCDGNGQRRHRAPAAIERLRITPLAPISPTSLLGASRRQDLTQELAVTNVSFNER